ncbi:MAG: adenylyltransferase/cytidyltransferase family protein [Parcubacteria group bacterium]|nr:adenylyltransferase/cytidyltransferase family protein [Parcubacteria group bacterium]
MPKKRKFIVAVSGGFDPLHIGHVRYMEEAKLLGDELVVILNNDNWLRKKKGHVFMPEKERKEIIEALRPVDRVVLTSHPKNAKDMSVCRALKIIRPDIFANGGDRNIPDSKKKSSSLNPEVELCRRLGIRMAWNVGKGGKIQSSSWLLRKYLRKAKKR